MHLRIAPIYQFNVGSVVFTHCRNKFIIQKVASIWNEKWKMKVKPMSSTLSTCHMNTLNCEYKWTLMQTYSLIFSLDAFLLIDIFHDKTSVKPTLSLKMNHFYCIRTTTTTEKAPPFITNRFSVCVKSKWFIQCVFFLFRTKKYELSASQLDLKVLFDFYCAIQWTCVQKVFFFSSLLLARGAFFFIALSKRKPIISNQQTSAVSLLTIQYKLRNMKTMLE